MSNKLSKKQLDLLIERVLNEVNFEKPDWDDWGTYLASLPDEFRTKASMGRFKKMVKDKLKPKTNPPKNFFGDGEDDQSTYDNYKNKLSSLASIDNNPGNISQKDVTKGIESSDADVKDMAMNIAVGKKFSPMMKFKIINTVINNIKKKKEYLEVTRAYQQHLEDGAPVMPRVVYDYINKRMKYPPEGNNQFVKDVVKALNDHSEAELRDFKLTFKAVGGNKAPDLVIRTLQRRREPKFKFLAFKKADIEAANFAALQSMTPEVRASTVAKSQPQLSSGHKDQLLSQMPDVDFTYLDEPDFPYETEKQKAPAPFGKLNLSYGDLVPDEGYKEIASPEGTRTFGNSIDPSVAATVDGVEGNSMLEKITKLSEFMQDLDNKINTGSIAKVSSAIRMMSFLAESVREYEESAAGIMFETFLALIGKGVVIGGESGATDIVTISGGSPVYYSAKLVSSEGFSQSDQADIGLTAVIKEASMGENPQGLIYVVGFKTDLPLEKLVREAESKKTVGDLGQAKRPKAVAFCVFRMKKVEGGEDRDVYVQVISGGKEKIVPERLKNLGQGKEKVKMDLLFKKIVDEQLWFSYMPIFPEIGNLSNIQSVSERFSKKITDSSNEALKTLRDAFANIKTLESLAQQHTSRSDELDIEGHNTYITNIQKQYGDFKTNYNTVLNEFEGTQKISENKKKSKKDLDILIEQVILKRLLK